MCVRVAGCGSLNDNQREKVASKHRILRELSDLGQDAAAIYAQLQASVASESDVDADAAAAAGGGGGGGGGGGAGSQEQQGLGALEGGAAGHDAHREAGEGGDRIEGGHVLAGRDGRGAVAEGMVLMRKSGREEHGEAEERGEGCLEDDLFPMPTASKRKHRQRRAVGRREEAEGQHPAHDQMRAARDHTQGLGVSLNVESTPPRGWGEGRRVQAASGSTPATMLSLHEIQELEAALVRQAKTPNPAPSSSSSPPFSSSACAKKHGWNVSSAAVAALPSASLLPSPAASTIRSKSGTRRGAEREEAGGGDEATRGAPEEALGSSDPTLEQAMTAAARDRSPAPALCAGSAAPTYKSATPSPSPLLAPRASPSSSCTWSSVSPPGGGASFSLLDFAKPSRSSKGRQRKQAEQGGGATLAAPGEAASSWGSNGKTGSPIALLSKSLPTGEACAGLPSLASIQAEEERNLAPAKAAKAKSRKDKFKNQVRAAACAPPARCVGCGLCFARRCSAKCACFGAGCVVAPPLNVEREHAGERGTRRGSRK